MARPTLLWSLRAGGWMLILAAGLCVAAFLGALLASATTHNAPLLVVCGVCMGGSCLLTLAWLRRRERQRAEILQSNFRRCPTCFHDLRGLAHHGHCPECGQEYGEHMLETLWSSSIGSRPPEPRRPRAQ